jgi:hypothetical protein
VRAGAGGVTSGRLLLGGWGGAGGELTDASRFLGHQVATKAIGHRKSANSPQPSNERPRLRARTRQIIRVLKNRTKIPSEDIERGVITARSEMSSKLRSLAPF